MDDPIVQRIFERSSIFQGYTPSSSRERLQLTKYTAGQQIKPHWDHMQFGPVPTNYTQRETTIFAVLEADCEECGTRFPFLSIDWSKADRRWCRYVDCNDVTGLTIKPVPGNAIFWKNLDANGEGVFNTLHAGLPPLEGTKTGLNIWTLAEG